LCRLFVAPKSTQKKNPPAPKSPFVGRFCHAFSLMARNALNAERQRVSVYLAHA
jgi:hypothetical protein